MAKFTDMYLKSLKPMDKKYQVREATGFALRIATTGRKTFLFIYESGGKRKEVNLGCYPATSIADARDQYNELRKKWDRGQEPMLPKKPKPSKEPAIITVTDLAEKYSAWSSAEKQNENHLRTKRRAIEMYLLPEIGSMDCTKVTRKEIVRVFNALKGMGVTTGALRNTLKATNAMFEYAVLQGVLDVTPCYSIRKSLPSIRDEERTRALSSAEIAMVWQGIEKAGAFQESKNALKLILVTAQRPGEVLSMEWKDIDGDWWTIPPEKAKKGKRYHRVFLTPLAKELMGTKKGEGFVFPSPHVFSVGHIVISVIQKIARSVKLETPWTPHDLRRTARTHMSRLRIRREHSEAVLNHAKQGMVKVYDQYEFDDEKKEALQLWEAELRLLIQSTSSS